MDSTTIQNEATMFALFSFKVLMGENGMREQCLNVASDLYFPKNIENKGTFAAINSLQWENRLHKFLFKITNNTNTNKRWISTVITPHSCAYDISHYVSLMFDNQYRICYIFDSLLSVHSDSVLNKHDIGMCEELKNTVMNWCRHSEWDFKYIASTIAWQDVTTDSWCQTWSLLFQKKVVEGKEPLDICRELVKQEDRRDELMNLVKTPKSKKFNRELEAEYQAQLDLHGADSKMKQFKARELIENSEYRHFFHLL